MSTLRKPQDRRRTFLPTVRPACEDSRPDIGGNLQNNPLILKFTHGCLTEGPASIVFWAAQCNLTLISTGVHCCPPLPLPPLQIPPVEEEIR